MASYRRISSTLTLLAVSMAAMTAGAAASPLLGGYGGPGEGNQAILGSALVGGAGGGGGSSSGPGGGSLSSPATGAGTSAGHGEAEPGGSGQRGSSAGGGAKGGGGAAGRISSSRDRRGKASGDAPGKDLVSPRDDASQTTASGGAQTLGLSAADLGYVLLALGVLVATGLITRRLARTPTGPAGPVMAKAIERRTRVTE